MARKNRRRLIVCNKLNCHEKASLAKHDFGRCMYHATLGVKDLKRFKQGELVSIQYKDKLRTAIVKKVNKSTYTIGEIDEIYPGFTCTRYDWEIKPMDEPKGFATPFDRDALRYNARALTSVKPKYFISSNKSPKEGDKIIIRFDGVETNPVTYHSGYPVIHVFVYLWRYAS